jgi:hypothetical protein
MLQILLLSLVHPQGVNFPNYWSTPTVFESHLSISGVWRVPAQCLGYFWKWWLPLPAWSHGGRGTFTLSRK